MPFLVIEDGGIKGQRFAIQGDVTTIGRGRWNDIVLRDSSVSSRHSQIVRTPEGKLTIEDLNSTNGTLIDGKKISSCDLNPSMVLTIGHTALRFDDSDVDMTPPPEGPASPFESVPTIFVDVDTATREFWLGEEKKEEEEEVPADARERFSLLHDVTSELNRTLLLDELVKTVLDRMIEIVNAERGVLLLYLPGRNEVVPVASRKAGKQDVDPFPVSRTVLNQVMRDQVGILSSDALVDERFEGAQSLAIQSIRSFLCAPLRAPNRMLGAAYVDCRFDASSFKEEDLQIFTIICNTAASAINNAQTYNKLEDLNEKLEDKVRERTHELEEAMEDLKQAETQLVHSEKMAGLGQLVAGVAHEINNPINFIVNGVDPLRMHIDSFREVLGRLLECAPEDAAELAELQQMARDQQIEFRIQAVNELADTIKEGAKRTSEIVRDLKEFSRHDHAALETVDLETGIDKTLNILAHEFRQGIEVQKNYGKLPPIRCFASQMNQVFMNLLANAVQAIDGDGTVTITTRCEDNKAIVEIRDTGCGIPEEVLSKIFEPFFTTKDVGVGTGLGLSISYGIMQQHGGQIGAESEVGKGTTFRVELPVDGSGIKEAEEGT